MQRYVYIVTKEGPEWGEVVAVFAKKDDADALAAEKNAVPDAKRADVFERLSTWEVTRHVVQGA